jgi:hypothetical protein
MRRRGFLLLLAAGSIAGCSIALGLVGAAGAGESPVDPGEIGHLSPTLAQLLSGGAGGVGGGSLPKSTCTSSGDPAANVALNCDNAISPDNETPIVADPNDPNHLLAGSNDYFLTFKGSTIQERVPTGFFTSFDGGATWTDGQIPMGNGSSGGNGDPSPAFDTKFGTAHMAQLSVAFGQHGPYSGHIDISVSTSTDGGLHWQPPVTVAVGHASISPSVNGVFLDKEWLTADNYPGSPHYGRLYLSWDQVELSKGVFQRSPVVLSFSDDAGKTWSRPQEISGSSALCTANQGPAGPPGACDESFFSYSAVEPNGDVVVAFMNQQHEAAWEVPNEFEDQVLAVRSTDGGAHFSDPVQIADLEDGGVEGVVFSDFPENVDATSTLTGHQLRMSAWGSLGVDPATGELYAVWADNRDGTRDVVDPQTGELQTPVTQAHVFMSTSSDEGQSWSGAIPVDTSPGDKWFPAVAAHDGTVGVAYVDGSYDWPNRDLYGITLATSADGGANWSRGEVSTALSDPNHSVWFQAHADGCDTCTTFMGDYIGLAYDTLGRAHVTWTDMRRDLSVPELGRTGKAQDAEYARR